MRTIKFIKESNFLLAYTFFLITAAYVALLGFEIRGLAAGMIPVIIFVWWSSWVEKKKEITI